MTAEKLHGDGFEGDGRYTGGGNDTHWPISGDLIEYRRVDPSVDSMVFVPEVLAPAHNAPKDAPTLVNPDKVYIYLKSNATTRNVTWRMPRSWYASHVSVH